MNKLFRRGARVLGIDDKTVSAELVFVGAEEMRALNLRTRGVDAVTDVLSFPNLDLRAGDVPTVGAFPLDINPKTNKIELGSVVVCKGFESAHTEDFLVVHGFLHLLGYTHDTEGDYNAMYDLTQKILGC